MKVSNIILASKYRVGAYYKKLKPGRVPRDVAKIFDLRLSKLYSPAPIRRITSFPIKFRIYQFPVRFITKQNTIYNVIVRSSLFF